ncbi:hypothetical protein J4H86_24195 [Spiractinospora alimapuensis]|uniref:hypothetical protein n=1 Tax=Spiractinospora alimapuensis TaxID=2820884 RepID=UPI001F23E539|nr:hypothetical protein [Spiractinospora alimapuensis]QVQ51829.1 hypothetical protein J4H86_24195 [Spiractinospora alimapuensis]
MPDQSEVLAEIEQFVKESLNTAGDGDLATNIHDLDSFSVVRLLLHLERAFDVSVLEELPNFEGVEFAELAEFVVRAAEQPTTNS